MDKQSRKDIINSYKARKAAGGVFAIKNMKNGKMLVQQTIDLFGSANRFEFSKVTGSCSFKQIEQDFKKFGAHAFSFEIIEELAQKEGQSDADFLRDIKQLYGIIIANIDPERLY